MQSRAELDGDNGTWCLFWLPTKGEHDAGVVLELAVLFYFVTDVLVDEVVIFVWLPAVGQIEGVHDYSPGGCVKHAAVGEVLCGGYDAKSYENSR